MRPFRALLSVALVALTAASVAGPASAGGVQSVLLVEPGTRNAASLYRHLDADYERLGRLVGANKAGGGGTVDHSGMRHAFGPEITLMWLMSDVMVIRVDRIFLEAPGGPWISTRAR